MSVQATLSRRAFVSYATRRKLVPYAYVAPAMALFALLMLYPMIAVFRYSLMDGAIIKRNPTFVGFANYVANFENPVFWQAVGQTLYFTSLSVIFHLAIGMGFALLLNSPLVNPTLRSLLRTLYVLPWLFTAVIIAIIWRLLLDPEGVINAILMALHVVGHKVEWFSSTTTALDALTFVNVWAGYPLYMVSLLAGLQGVPKELYEAAGIDGANAIEKFRFITVPQLTPIIISIALLDFIWTMQVFPLVWTITGGGPIYSTEVMSTYTYKQAFADYDFSMASSSAICILLMSLSATYFYVKHQKAQ
ncbi:MAG: sugar ABC transporter permease [Hyphomicrobiales bacterium]|nr:sugar ABC transporter permease [Hyphomicrobiales bacterium]MDE2016525.1 sugar ABC transporter permease [Hyphomicrobiales bacterium]